MCAKDNQLDGLPEDHSWMGSNGISFLAIPASACCEASAARLRRDLVVVTMVSSRKEWDARRNLRASFSPEHSDASDRGLLHATALPPGPSVGLTPGLMRCLYTVCPFIKYICVRIPFNK